MNLQQFYLGQVFDAYEFFGAHKVDGGIEFCVYAPNAIGVSLIGEFNGWQEEPMKRDGGSGIYRLQSRTAKVGQMYKYCIHTQDGRKVDHCDPYGFGMELRPNSASYIVDLDEYQFTDDKWMKTRTKCYDKPMNIYEVHMGSWKRNKDDANGWYRYNEIAEELVEYVKENGYTHIEIMPLSEHPVDGSWGYQNTGFYSPTSRYGTAKELKELINYCHRNGIGVFIDFVPVHFAIDSYALANFDGTALYEYPHSDVGNSEWGTYNFIHSRGDVCSFLQSAANYWLKEYHFDGIRMDAISRAIYWQGDTARGVNNNAVNFIKTMNQGLHKLHPTAILMAEDSTAFPKVTGAVEEGGLGFDYKWDLGWMNDTLEYFKIPPTERSANYHKLTFSMQYFYSERFLLPFSHDEVVHGKATIMQKMWGLYEDKFRQCRALYLYMYAHPGKKLNFMGNEIGQFREWDEKAELDWELLRYPAHDSFYHYIRKLNEIYCSYSQLFDGDYDSINYHWLEVNAPEQSVYIFERGEGPKKIVAALNFSNQEYESFPIITKEKRVFKELISSDYDIYGGETIKKHGKVTAVKKTNGDYVTKVKLPAFTGILWVSEEVSKEK